MGRPGVDITRVVLLPVLPAPAPAISFAKCLPDRRLYALTNSATASTSTTSAPRMQSTAPPLATTASASSVVMPVGVFSAPADPSNAPATPRSARNASGTVQKMPHLVPLTSMSSHT